MSKMIIVEGNSNDKDNVRVYMVKGEKGDTGDVNTEQLNAEISARTNADSDLKSQIDSLASGSPLIANSTSEMTDTTRVYVNTSDGYWYYYNGTSWVQGGVYQSTQNGENSIKFMMLDTNLQEYIIPSEYETEDYATTGKMYVGSVGDTISQSDVTDAECGVMDVVVGNTIIVPFIVPSSTNEYYPLIFTNSNDEIISKIYRDIINNKVNAEGIYKIIVPTGATKLYFNNGKNNNRIYYPFKISKYNYFDKRVSDNLNTTEEMNISETITGKIYSTFVWDYTISNFKTEVYSVTPLEKIHIETTIPGDNQFVPAIFLDADDKPVGFYNQRGTNYDTAVSFDTIVPASANKLYICTRNGVTNKVQRYKINDGYKLNASMKDGILTITNLLNGNYLQFKNWGGNNLFMIYKYKVGNTEVQTYSDMIPAPYIVFAINNADGDINNETHTGGNHQYNDQGSGSTDTARQVSLSITCDDKTLNDNTSVNCNNVKIVEINRIQGTNTKKSDGTGREILEEKIVFNFDGTHLKVKNTITPLEEIRIKKYYGIQTAYFNDSLYKIYADKVYSSSEQASVPSKPSAIYGSDIICSKLYDSGLGDYRYNFATNKNVVIAYNKSYYVPIFDNNTINFDTSNINYIEGEYIFDDNQI